jgi:hypothetical protein
MTYLAKAYHTHLSNIHESSTGILVPLYSYPGKTWNDLIEEKMEHRSVPMVAIINPSNGSGVEDSNYTVKIQRLQTCGITVLGYVHTLYGIRNSFEITGEINNYKNWYHLNGIFFDEMSNIAGKENYYKHLSDYAKSLDLSMTVGNPGTDTQPSYIGVVDNIVIHDKPGLPSIESLSGWHTNYDKSNFSIISHDVDNLDKKYVRNASNYVGYIYATSMTSPNPWILLPSYLNSLVASLQSELITDHIAKG